MLFPAKLRGLLDDAVVEGNEHLISWLPGGNAFKIHDPDLLAERVLKRYFRQNSFKSFTRQL
jgi:HSF-type DNA-binding